MTSFFKAERNLIQIVQSHSIGKAVCESTNLDLGKIFEHCSLEIPDEAQPGVGWLVTWSPNELDIDRLICTSFKFCLNWLGSISKNLTHH